MKKLLVISALFASCQAVSESNDVVVSDTVVVADTIQSDSIPSDSVAIDTTMYQ